MRSYSFECEGKVMRTMVVVISLLFGLFAAVVVDWERKSEIHGLAGPLEVPFGFSEPYRFIFNAMFYAGLLWLVVSLVRAWGRGRQRAKRIERGLCPKCAYDLRGCKDAEKCPECGQLLGPSQLVHYREVG